MKQIKQVFWAALITLVVLSVSWAQYPHGASDPTYGLRSRADEPGFTYTPSPEDWRDINIYQIFTDRFASSGENISYIQNRGWYVGSRTDSEARNFHHGGDWKGLQQNIPYLKGMGINAVWISGVQLNDQGKDLRFTPYHMYHPTDFFKVDPAMGTFQDLKNVIDALHANGIYVILDVVINHTADKNGLRNGNDDKWYWPNGGPNFGWWNDGNRHAPPFDDLQWFHNNGTINNWDAFPETLRGQFKGTDDLATDTPHVTFWITEAFKNLIDATDCDGFRVDAIKHVEYNWVKKWADDIRKYAESRGKDDFILFGELFVYDNNALASYCKEDNYSFNSALFFPMSQTIKNVFIDGAGTGQLTAQLNNRFGYGEGANRLVTFIDNHDVNRISIVNGGDTGNDIWKLRPALSFLYLATPVPCLFYGTEHAFNQGNHFNGSSAGVDYDDADWQRETMFNKGFQPGPAQGNKLAETNAPLYQHIAKLNEARKNYRALTRGNFTQRWDSGGQGPYAFTRLFEDQEALVALNTADGNVSLQPAVSKPDGTEYVNVLNTSEKATVSQGKLSISLAGKETKVFVAGSAAGSSTLTILDSNTSHDYATLNYYINEPTDRETLRLELNPADNNVEQAQIWSNLGRRDYATLGPQAALVVPGPGPASTNYFVGFPMTNAGGNTWRIEMPIDKTGAYRVTARYRVAGATNWTWVGGRDLAVMVSPKKSRDVILYEAMVNVINATGDSEATRSTFEDMMNPAKPGNLDHFEDLGINTLWIQPIHPIGANPCPTIAAGEGPGSPYSIKNMWEVAPHMSAGNTREASMAAFTNFAAAAQDRGIDFFFDIIFNHTSWDAEVGRDPDNPSLLHPTPTAKIKDLYPQWYSRYNSTSLPCGEYDYLQSNFAFQFPAQNANQLGPAPAERNDFGKWPDVVDLFWGTYPALLNPQAADDTYWDTTQTGADVERMAEYFAYFGQYWIEQSGGTLGGFRCDYAQGLPPQAWEYFVNKIRQTKWDFIFMAESLDGGNVSKRAGRHMDIINQNWVWQVLENGGNTTGFRSIIDQNKRDYGYAGIMRGLVNHDQNAPDDKWYTFSRYAVGAVVDGAPQLYQGQELGYTNGWGFSQFRNQFDRDIPHIFKWHNMQTLWNNRDTELEAAYASVNKGRMLAGVNRLHDQWYLDTVTGGPDQEIFSVLKYEKFGWDPAHQEVVLNFVNLTPGATQEASFSLAGVQAVYINPERIYNVRNLSGANPDRQIWENGISGAELLANGIYVGMPGSGEFKAEYGLVQMLKLEEHNEGFNPGDRDYISWVPEAPVGCEELIIRYAKADSLLGANPVLVHMDVNGWTGIPMADGGSNWVYYYTPSPGVETINFTFSDGNNNWEGGGDFSVTFGDGGCTGEVPVVVWTTPEVVSNCSPVIIYYNAAGRILSSANPVYIYIGRNNFQDITTNAMTFVSNSVWSYTYAPTTGTKTINFVFNDGNPDEGSRIWDNNSNNDWSKAIGDCGSNLAFPDFGVTFPSNNTVVANGVGAYTITGVASNMSGQLRWTNSLTGETGLVPASGNFTIPQMPLGVGTNVITISGTTGGSGGITTVAVDRASNYSANWASGASRGTGFGNWTLEKSADNAGHFTDNRGFGMWSYEGGNYAAASLAFTSALSSGQTFRAYVKNGWLWENGGSVGFAMRDASGYELWKIFFNGGDQFYVQGGGTAENATDIPWTDGGMDVAFTLTGANNYSVTVTPLTGTARTFTGTFTNSPSNFRAWSANNGTNDEFNPNRDFFFDNPMITAPGSAGSVTSTTVTIIRLPVASEPDANNDGIPDSWMVQFGLDIMASATNVGANGMTYRESYLAGLNPTDPADYLMLEAMASTNNPGAMAFRWYARPVGSYKVMASRTGVAGPYTNMVASRATEGGAAYHITVDDPLAGEYEHSFYRLELDPDGDTGGGGGVVSVTVNATPGSTTFTNVAGIPVTLTVSGGTITESTYAISTNAAVTFTNGQVITLGEDLGPGESLSLSLFGQNASGSSDRKTYTYTRANTALTLTNVVRYNTWPPNGQITSASEIWIDVFAQPRGAGVSADIIYCAGADCEGSEPWTVAPMSRNPPFDNVEQNTEWWNINLGTFPAGTEIRYAVVVRDYRGSPAGEVWDSNGPGNYYSATVNSDGGGGEPGGMMPPSTNPTFGQAGAATIDGANTGNEWNDNNLIAIDLVNDDPRSLGSNWTMHEGPADLTHMWARWDDTKLYLAWQFADITDVLDPSNAGSAQGGSVFNSQGILQFISFNTGAGGAASNMWSKFDTFAGADLPNVQIAMRSDLWGDHPYLSKAVDGAFVVDKDLGTNYFTRTQAGIQIAKGQLNAATALYGVGDIDQFLSNPTVTLNNYIGHDKSRDTFYEMSIPLATLGVTRAQIESSGIGVFIYAGSASAIDSIPNDPVTLNTPGVTDSNSTWEWEDGDVFTRPFARIGGN